MAKDNQKQDRQELVVFSIINDTECSECGRELWRGNFITLEKGKALCMSCADLDHLWYLPAGNAALTRRAKNTPDYTRWSCAGAGRESGMSARASWPNPKPLRRPSKNVWQTRRYVQQDAKEPPSGKPSLTRPTSKLLQKKSENSFQTVRPEKRQKLRNTPV